MATRFKPLKLDNPDFFGIGLAGSVGRGDKSHLLELAEKCLANDKVKLVMDLSELSALGGGGAVILADFQKSLVKVGGEILFVGAGEVVRHFLEQKFDDLPLNFYDTAAEAMVRPAARVESPAADEPPLAEVEQIVEAVPELDQPVVDTDEPAMDDLEDPPDLAAASMLTEGPDPDSGLDDLLDEIKGPEMRKGRRKDHRYTSLNEAVQAMGEWVAAGDKRGFQKALGNLLFSNGLAEDMALFVVVKDRLKQADGTNWVPLDGSLVGQVKEAGRPLVMEDIRDEGLGEEELSLLESMQPDILLPIMRADTFWGVAMLNRGSLEPEFSLAENFALELLMQVLAPKPVAADEAPAGANPVGAKTAVSPKATAPKAKSLKVANGEDVELQEVLLKLAMELPESEDRPQFWRIFSRVVWPVFPLKTLAFLSVDRNFAHTLIGSENSVAAVDLSQEKLKSYFRTLQRPVLVSNLPDFFRETRKTLTKCGLDWLVALKDEQEYLGLVLVGREDSELDTEDAVPDRVMALFDTAAQMLSRFESRNENADVSLDLVRLLVAQRERRCFGSDSMTRSIVDHVNLLAQELGFPPDQRRDLICGSLLRDAGLVGMPDAWAQNPSALPPKELSEYRDHPRQGALLLESLNLPKVIVEVVQYHHERFEGGGFPFQKTGRDIPLAARVVTVVENYVGMITGVGGQTPLTPAQAGQALREDQDKRFDPDIVQVFLSVVSQEVPVAP